MKNLLFKYFLNLERESIGTKSTDSLFQSAIAEGKGLNIIKSREQDRVKIDPTRFVRRPKTLSALWEMSFA